MKKKILNLLKQAMRNYGELALMAYYPTGITPRYKD
jgi:hypothetical protein